VVEALLAEAARLDVAVTVEDREGVPVLEHPGPFISHAGDGQDVVRPAVGPIGDRRPAAARLFLHRYVSLSDSSRRARTSVLVLSCAYRCASTANRAWVPLRGGGPWATLP